MKSNIIFRYVLFSLLILLNVFVIIRSKATLNKEKDMSYLREKQLQDKIISYINFNNGIKLNKTLDLVSKFNMTKRTDLLDTNKTYLVLKISDQDCSSCVESSIYNLNRNLHKVAKKFPVIILMSSDHLSNNTLGLFERELKNQYTSFGIASTYLSSISFEKLGVPYFFLLKGKELKNIFIPDSDFPNLTATYFDYIAMNADKI